MEFLVAVRSSFEFLVEHPFAGPEYPITLWQLAGLRKWRVSGYRNYLIFYIPSSDSLRVIRVIHGARDIPNLLADEPAEE